MNRPLVNQDALEEFLESADATDARRAAKALTAMAAAAEMAAVELEAGHRSAPVRATSSPVRFERRKGLADGI
jgi:hypothetical protein